MSPPERARGMRRSSLPCGGGGRDSCGERLGASWSQACPNQWRRLRARTAAVAQATPTGVDGFKGSPGAGKGDRVRGDTGGVDVAAGEADLVSSMLRGGRDGTFLVNCGTSTFAFVVRGCRLPIRPDSDGEASFGGWLRGNPRKQLPFVAEIPKSTGVIFGVRTTQRASWRASKRQGRWRQHHLMPETRKQLEHSAKWAKNKKSGNCFNFQIHRNALFLFQFANTQRCTGQPVFFDLHSSA